MLNQVFDPFALIPTSTFVPLTSGKPDTYVSSPQLIPQLPPQDYSKTQTTQTTQVAKPDNDALFSHFLTKAVKETIAPLYEYSFEEEKRYSNPYLQFNPKPLGGYDTEDIYGKFQGSGEQLWNSLVKTGATAATSFISSFTTLGPSIDAIRSGKPFDEDSVLGETQKWLRDLENDYPNYYTQWERDHPFMSAVTPVGLANFWGDKVLKNVGYTIGSLASALVVDAGITLATQGTATPATFILAANQIRRAISPLKNLFRSLSKVSTLNKVDELAGVSRVGEGLTHGLKSMNQAYNFKKAAQFAGTTYFAAQGEAMVEGYQTYWQTKEDLYKQELAKGELDYNKLSEIETLAQEAANTTTVLNLPIIMASNLLQFPTIFAGKSLLKQFDSPFLQIVNKEGLTAVNNYSRKQAWVNTMKELAKDFVTEGGEEGYQYYIGNSIHDYYIDKFNGTAANSLSNFLAQQLPKKVQEEGFWESTIIGGLAGGLMGSVHTFKKNLIGANDRTERAKEVLQPVLDRFNSTVKDYVHFAENVEHQADENPTNAFQSAHKALFSTVHDSLKYGVFDNFQDSLEDLKEIPIDEYNKLFGTEFNEVDRLHQITKIQSESFKIKDDLTQVNKFYQNNPFDSPYVTQRLKDIYKIDQTQVDNVKAQLFNEFKELVTYNISRLRNTKGRIGEIEQELKTYGLNDSIIPVLYNLGSDKGLNQYKRLKQVQLSTLEDEVKYYEELGMEQPELHLKVGSLKALLKRLDKVKPDSEEFRKIIFEEEVGVNQMVAEEEFLKKQEELRKQQELAKKTAEDLEEQTTKPEQKVKEQVETLSKIVPPEEKKVEKPKISPEIFNRNFNSLNEGDTFKITLATEEGEFTLITKHPFVAEKDGVKYQFTPKGAIRYPEGDLIRYALDSIGVQKVSQPEPAEMVEPQEPSQPVLKSKESIIQDLVRADGTKPIFVVLKDGSKYQVNPLSRYSKQTDSVLLLDGNEVDVSIIDRVEASYTDKTERIEQKPSTEGQARVDKNNRKQIIIDLLEFNGNIEQVFTKNGYLNVKGIYVHPDVVDTFNKLDTETIELLKNNGIVYVDNLSTDGAAGVTLGYKYGDQSIMGIGLANIGLFNNPNQIALHELGHVIWEKLSKEEQDLFYDGKPITEHGKRVLNPTGKFKDLYGQGSTYGEEDFAQAFAESKGNLKEVFKKKKGTTKPKKETITKKEQLKQAIDKNKDKVVKPVKDGIYLIEGDYTNAWRYVDENTAVPLTLKLKGTKLTYEGDMTRGVEKKIESGYLLDEQYIEKSFGEDLRPLLDENFFNVKQVPFFEYHVQETTEQERLKIEKIKEFKSLLFKADASGSVPLPEQLTLQNTKEFLKVLKSLNFQSISLEDKFKLFNVLSIIKSLRSSVIKIGAKGEKIGNYYKDWNLILDELKKDDYPLIAYSDKLMKSVFRNERDLIIYLQQNPSDLEKSISSWEKYKDEHTFPIPIKIGRTLFSQDTPVETWLTNLKNKVRNEEPVFGVDIREIYQEGLTTEEITGKDKGLSLAELSKKLKDKQQNQSDNLNKFINQTTQPISDSLKQVLEWRVGKGITIDC